MNSCGVAILSRCSPVFQTSLEDGSIRVPSGALAQGSHAGIPILRTVLYPSHDKSAIRRIMNYASFSISAATLGTVGITKPDVVYAYHPPATIALPATVFRLLRRVPVVADIQDLWPDTVIETGMMKSAFAVSLLNKCCRLAFGQMDRVVVQSPGLKTDSY